MLPTKKMHLGLVVLFITLVQLASGQTTSNTNNPDWDSGGDWTGSAPGYDTNQSLILANNSDISGNPLIINDGHTLTINGGVTLTTDETVTVKEGASLIVNGTIQGTGSGKEIKIEKGTLIVNGALNWNGGGVWTSDDNPVTIIINGSVNVAGDMSNKVTISGTGTIDVGGTLNNDGGSIFGCTDSGSGCCGGTGCTIPEPLPVELLSFNAVNDDNSVVLSWKTATEIDNDYFNVERSTTSDSWKTIATIEGAGDSNEILSYECVDNNPPLGLIHYRLKQTDYDGSTEYPGLTDIYINPGGSLQTFPNPGNSMLTLSILDAENANFQMTTLHGQIVYAPARIYGDRVEFDVSQLRRGIYILKTNLGSQSFQSKIVLR